MIKTITTVQSVSRCGGGLFDGVRRLTQCLADEAVQSEVFSIRDDFTDADIDRWAELRPRVCADVGPAGYSPELLSAVLACKNGDMAHGHGLWNFTGIAAYKWARRYRKPYIVSPHGMLNPMALRSSRWKKMLAGALFERRYLAGASCIRALSVKEAESIRAYGLKNPICIIPNGADVSDNVGIDFRGKLAKKTLLYLGRLHSGKNLESLLMAWSLVMKGVAGLLDGWQLTIAGWGEPGYENKLRVFAKELSLGESVVFTGPKFEDDKTGAYKEAEAFILPSFYEGSPIALLEAWANGLPVLMTPECGVSAGYKKGAAILINTAPDSIATGIKEMAAMTDEQRVEMGRHGLQLVKDEYLWSDVALKMKMVYHWVLGKGEYPDCMMR